MVGDKACGAHAVGEDLIAQLHRYALEWWWLCGGPGGPAQCGQVDIPFMGADRYLQRLHDSNLKLQHATKLIK